MSEKILSIFEKHIGKQQNANCNRRIIENIKDTNAIIGALQTIDLALKKSLNCLEHPDRIATIVDQCSFMGQSLFDAEISIAPIHESFYIEKLQDVLQCNSIEETKYFIQDKQEEIKRLLGCIFQSLDDADDHAQLTSNTKPISLEKFF